MFPWGMMTAIRRIAVRDRNSDGLPTTGRGVHVLVSTATMYDVGRTCRGRESLTCAKCEWRHVKTRGGRVSMGSDDSMLSALPVAIVTSNDVPTTGRGVRM